MQRRKAGSSGTAHALLYGWRGLCCAVLLSLASPAIANDLDHQRAAVEQLIRGQLESGLLDFDMDFLAGKGAGSGKTRAEKSAFIARQAGTAYGIAKYFEQTNDERVREPLIKFIDALEALSLPIGKSMPQRAVEATRILSLPVFRVKVRNTLERMELLYQPSGDGALVAYEQGYPTAWAGTTALALLAELHYFRATGDARFATIRERWLAGIEALRAPGRGFREYPDVIDEKPFANGEAWLAHAVYIDTFPSGSVSAAAMRDIDDYMIATYVKDRLFFHFGAMAAARRFHTTQDRRFIDFLQREAQAALDAAPQADSPEASCALVEGLAASAGAMARGGWSDKPLYAALRQRIRLEMDKNNRLQLQRGQDRLALGGDGVLIAPRLGDYAGAYLFGRYTPTVRIDMTHHCISAIAEMQSE
jgi:hypothetical protein